MITCPNCGQLNPQEATRCEECDADLQRAKPPELRPFFWISTVLFALVLVVQLAVGWHLGLEKVVLWVLAAIFGAASLGLYLRIRQLQASFPPPATEPPVEPAATTPPARPAGRHWFDRRPAALPQQLSQFALGFGGWWLLNTLVGWVGCLLGGSSWPQVVTTVGTVLFFVNILAIVPLAFWRRWIGSGMLVALAVNLVGTTILYTSSFSVCGPSPSYGCAVPFFLPLGP